MPWSYKHRPPPSRLKPLCIGSLLLGMSLFTSLAFTGESRIKVVLVASAMVMFFASIVLAFLDLRQDYAKVTLTISTIFVSQCLFGVLTDTLDRQTNARKKLLRSLASAPGRGDRDPSELTVPVMLPRESLAQQQPTPATLPRELSLDLGGGVAMKFKLVPSGSFMMGTPGPPRPAFAAAGALLTIAGAAAAWLWFLFQHLKARQKNGRIQFSLASYFVLMLLFSCVTGGIAWHLKLEHEWERFFSTLPTLPLDQIPAREILITKPFYLSEFEVTREQYARIAETDISAVARQFRASPVDRIDWWNAGGLFCRRLSERTGRRVRLPTEAEWEYAHSLDPAAFKGSKLEWCSDWHAPYDPRELVDPRGEQRGNARIARGRRKEDGAVTDILQRDQYLPDSQRIELGFRVVCEVE